MKQLADKKIAKILTVCVLVLGVILILGMIYTSSILSNSFPFFSRLSQEEKAAEIASAGTRLRAPILDRNSVVLSDYSETAKSSGKTLTDDDYVIVKYPYSFSSLFGYSSTRYGVGGGIWGSLNSTLTVGTNSFLNIKNNIGNTVKLTIDAETQSYAYDLMRNFKGAMIVTNSSGEILCMLSTPSYNSNNIKADESEIFTDEEYDSIFYNNCYEYPRTPGSVFKMISSVAICEAGLAETPYLDEGVTYTESGFAISNSSKATLGKEITLKNAICYSVNSYFADMVKKSGEKKFSEVANRFYIGKDIKLDFTTLKSNFDIKSDPGDEGIMASAFGQGRTLLTPLQINMITSAVATGNLVKPHLIKQVLSPGEGGKIVKTAKPEILESEIISYDTASTIRQGMLAAGEMYGLYSVYYKGSYVKIAAKTGTAEIDSSDGSTNNYITAYFPADNPQYFVTVLNVGVGRGSSLAYTLQLMCNYIASHSSAYEN